MNLEYTPHNMFSILLVYLREAWPLTFPEQRVNNAYLFGKLCDVRESAVVTQGSNGVVYKSQLSQTFQQYLTYFLHAERICASCDLWCHSITNLIPCFRIKKRNTEIVLRN